ncbi:MAG: hypothetical protein ACK5JM_01820 [Rhodoblastus sp.]
MVAIARMIALFASAVFLEIAQGVGLAVLLLGAYMGWRRAGAHWLLAPAVAGAIASQLLFAGAASEGKVANAMSHGVFQLFVYIFICLLGYAIGAVARKWR